MKHQQETIYVSPVVEFTEVALEQGIAVSGGSTSVDGDYIGGWNEEEEL